MLQDEKVEKIARGLLFIDFAQPADTAHQLSPSNLLDALTTAYEAGCGARWSSQRWWVDPQKVARDVLQLSLGDNVSRIVATTALPHKTAQDRVAHCQAIATLPGATKAELRGALHVAYEAGRTAASAWPLWTVHRQSNAFSQDARAATAQGALQAVAAPYENYGVADDHGRIVGWFRTTDAGLGKPLLIRETSAPAGHQAPCTADESILRLLVIVPEDSAYSDPHCMRRVIDAFKARNIKATFDTGDDGWPLQDEQGAYTLHTADPMAALVLQHHRLSVLPADPFAR